MTALGAHGSVDLLAAQALEFRPAVVALADSSRATELKSMLPAGIELLVGPDAMADAALTADTVINGVVRVRRSAGHTPNPRGRPPARPGQQGIAHLGRSRRETGMGDIGCRADTCRLRALRHTPVPQGEREPRSGHVGGSDRQWWAVPGTVTVRSRNGDHRRRFGPSDLVHGPEDHGRLEHVDEQGPRGDRGSRIVRHRL